MLSKNFELLREMLRYKRPHNSKHEEKFIQDFIIPIGVSRDSFGNFYRKIGDSKVIWSSHIDTVHSEGGFQKVVHDQKSKAFRLPAKSKSNCLGADCTTGIWIMLMMIEAGVEGLYIFHRGEECGGLGASWIAENQKDMLSEYDYAIAFDRYGSDSVVTHQGYGRCCSDEFAIALSDALGKNHSPDNTGIYTDTAEYTKIIPECTNVSVGYAGHHTSSEVQYLPYLKRLLQTLLSLDVSSLPVCRDPHNYTCWGNVTEFPMVKEYDFTSEPEEMIGLVQDYPDVVAEILMAYGLTTDELCAEIYDYTGHYKRKD